MCSFLLSQNTKAIACGLSDCHKMILAVIKMTFQKVKPKEILYRNFKHFDKIRFKTEVKEKLIRNDSLNYETFEQLFMNTLEKHAPLKKKIVRANHAPSYITRSNYEAISIRKCIYKKGTAGCYKAYKNKKNYCCRLYKKERKKLLKNVNLCCDSITDNKNIWNTVKPFLTNKGLSTAKITLTDNNKIVSTDQEVTETLNEFYTNALNSLNLQFKHPLVVKTKIC